MYHKQPVDTLTLWAVWQSKNSNEGCHRGSTRRAHPAWHASELGGELGVRLGDDWMRGGSRVGPVRALNAVRSLARRCAQGR